MNDDMPRWAKAMEERLAARMVTREEMNALRADLRAFATREDLAAFATREDLAAFATREDLIRFRADIMERIDRLQNALTKQVTEGEVNYNMAATMAGRVGSLEETVIALTRLVRMLSSRVDELDNRQKPGH